MTGARRTGLPPKCRGEGTVPGRGEQACREEDAPRSGCGCATAHPVLRGVLLPQREAARLVVGRQLRIAWHLDSANNAWGTGAWAPHPAAPVTLLNQESIRRRASQSAWAALVSPA